MGSVSASVDAGAPSSFMMCSTPASCRSADSLFCAPFPFFPFTGLYTTETNGFNPHAAPLSAITSLIALVVHFLMHPRCTCDSLMLALASALRSLHFCLLHNLPSQCVPRASAVEEDDACAHLGNEALASLLQHPGHQLRSCMTDGRAAVHQKPVHIPHLCQASLHVKISRPISRQQDCSLDRDARSFNTISPKKNYSCCEYSSLI